VFVVYKIDPSTWATVIEKKGDLNQAHIDLVAALPDSESRYAFYNLIYQTKEGNNRSKLFFTVWTPDGAGIRVSFSTASISNVRTIADKMEPQDRMMYNLNKTSFETKFSGGFVEHLVTDKSDLDLEALVPRA
jgi:hypothetical protein